MITPSRKHNGFFILHSIHINPISTADGISKKSDFMPEDAQTIAKGCIRAKSGFIPVDSEVREAIDRALIRQFDLLPVARKMVMEELANG